MAAGDIWQATVVHSLDGVNMANIFYVRTVEDSGIADPVDGINDLMNNQIIPNIISFQTDEVNYECNLIRKVHPMSEPATIIRTTHQGALSQPALPANNVVIVSHYSNDGKPRHRGRYFFSGIPKVYVVQGRIQQQLKHVADALIAKLVVQLTEATHTYRMMHYSRFLDIYSDIQSARLQPALTKHRSRTPGTCSIT